MPRPPLAETIAFMTHGDQYDALSKSMVRTRAHWIKLGISPRQLRTLVSAGDLVRIRHGSYATRRAAEWARDNPRRTHALQVHAAMDAVGRGAVASHESAAVMHDIALFKHPGDTVALTFPPGQRSGSRPGVAWHTATLPPKHVATMYGVPVTSPVRTVVDLARTLPFMEAVVVTDSAMHGQLASPPELLGMLELFKGLPGSPQARRAFEFASPNAESVLESCGRVILAEHGVEAPEVQYSIAGPGYRYHVDLCWPRYKTIVEFDGMVKYETRKDIRRQYDRDQHLRDAGYQVIHVTWHEIFRTPELVAERIRKAFSAVTAFLGPGAGRCCGARGSSPAPPGRVPGRDLTP